MAVCKVCFRHCDLKEGQKGFCGARICNGREVVCDNYGFITSIALDPIEKKPLNRFHSGSMILSVGSYGCNLRCLFCQNHEISWSEQAIKYGKLSDKVTPEQLAELAVRHKRNGNIGVAFTYNEPLIGWEFVRDTAKLVHEAGMLNVMVTNGAAELWVLDELATYIDAMNIDLKSFTDCFYCNTAGGDLGSVKRFIEKAVRICHVELTTLIIPDENDTETEMENISSWIALLTDNDGNRIGADIPLHISRFFPRFKMTDKNATDVRHIYHLAEIARRNLNYVYTGNC